ncbi:hypothetical protein VKT23_010171 [Stygiomarasmius scandens]|uniref:Retrotransposon gag domain-containing protein n=1 Tax=Marasmiellus scandens TaxID=2682957 RepID=A0ABR1JER3_9AGAR
MNEGAAVEWKMRKLHHFLVNRWPTADGFMDDFRKAFLLFDMAGDARIKLRTLRQTGPVDNYITEFQNIATLSGITEDMALIEYFMEGLNKIVEKMYDRAEVPTTIEDWYKYSAIYDSNWRRGRMIADRLQSYQDNRKGNTTKSTYSFP